MPTREVQALPGRHLDALATGTFSDLELVCQEHTFKVHKVILTAASGYFKSAINSSMLESQNSRIVLQDEDPSLVIRMLIYLYSGDYPKVSTSKHSGIILSQFMSVRDDYEHAHKTWYGSAELALRLYELADRRCITPFKNLCIEHFVRGFHDAPGSTYEDSKDNKRESKETDLSYDKHIATRDASIIKIAYSITTNTNDEHAQQIRNIIVTYFLVRIMYHDALECVPYQRLLADLPDFAYDVARSRLSSRSYECKHSDCGAILDVRLVTCKCGKLQRCDDQGCIERRRRMTVCDCCCRLGVNDLV